MYPVACCVLITECLAIVIPNIIIIVVFVKQRQLKRRSTYLNIHLATVDILVGAVSGSLFIYLLGSFCDLWELRLTSECYRALRITLIECFPFASLLNLAAISLGRVHAAFCPFRHRLIKMIGLWSYNNCNLAYKYHCSAYRRGHWRWRCVFSIFSFSSFYHFGFLHLYFYQSPR